MAKDEKSKAGGPKAGKASRAAVVPATAVGEPKPRITEKEYQRELKKLHGELAAMQEWVKATGAKVCIVFEGRDAAGKGGVIKAIMERVSPRVFRVMALPAPSDREKSQMFIQRYLPLFPAGGEVVIFDRSWYNRVGVERVMGFTPMDVVEKFLDQVPGVEKAMVENGIILLKYWLEVSPEEQTRRLTGRVDDARKTWKLSPMDVASYTKWNDYTVARDAMFTHTSTSWAPWFVAISEDKKRARLNIISHLLSRVPYKHIEAETVKLPKRSAKAVPPPPDTFHLVPETF